MDKQEIARAREETIRQFRSHVFDLVSAHGSLTDETAQQFVATTGHAYVSQQGKATGPVFSTFGVLQALRMTEDEARARCAGLSDGQRTPYIPMRISDALKHEIEDTERGILMIENLVRSADAKEAA